MDHPSNPNHPTHWHVRGDGWLGASFTRESSHGVACDHSLSLRYRLLVHSGTAAADLLTSPWELYARTPAYKIDSSRKLEMAALSRGETSS
jgi:Methane oxygenase PmoA